MTGVPTEIRGNILVVDDEPAIRHALRLTLRASGFGVAEASTGEQAVELIRRETYDAVLLDMNMPGMGGMTACREIRLTSPAIPILMLTIRDSQDDKIEAFEAGADDYVTKPFHMRELMARVRAAVRRVPLTQSEPDESLRIGEITLNPAQRTVFKAGRRIHVTPKELDLLQYLMNHAGTPVAHGRLLTAIWGNEYGGEIEYLRTFVHQLRKKLEDDPAHPTYLLTEAWFGYRFRAAE
jgi:two-component system KDP operon response regulator KdpE